MQSELKIGQSLDFEVLRSMGWRYVAYASNANDGGHWSSPSGEVFQFSPDISTSDPEAVRLCLPWLRERKLFVHLDDAWNPRTKSRVCVSTACIRDESFKYGTEWKTMTYEEGATFAECLCRLVLAVAEREAEQKEPTT